MTRNATAHAAAARSLPIPCSPRNVSPARNLWDQMGPATRSCVATLLGFACDVEAVAGEASGFKNNMREIKPLPDGFTIGDAFGAYIEHLRQSVLVK